ncbi:hypothetical protein ACHAWF_013932 [Thalassiosira exigua]
MVMAASVSCPLACLACLAFLILNLWLPCDAFAPSTSRPGAFKVVLEPPSPLPSSSGLSASATDGDASFVENLTRRYELFQGARSDGYDFKQSTAIAIAGAYDADEVRGTIRKYVDSAPCVMFTWENSPACKKAVKYLDVAGASYANVRLDDPWDEGNPIRAELGKMVGRSSVPCVFVGGEYVGGFDAGAGEDSPGLMEMAFKGTLREKLRDAGALQ